MKKLGKKALKALAEGQSGRFLNFFMENDGRKKEKDGLATRPLLSALLYQGHGQAHSTLE
jgi:hypothetical protein